MYKKSESDSTATSRHVDSPTPERQRVTCNVDTTSHKKPPLPTARKNSLSQRYTSWNKSFHLNDIFNRFDQARQRKSSSSREGTPIIDSKPPVIKRTAEKPDKTQKEPEYDDNTPSTVKTKRSTSFRLKSNSKLASKLASSTFISDRMKRYSAEFNIARKLL